MRQIFPVPVPPAEALDVDPLDAYDQARPIPEGRPWVVVDMVASVDGATAVDGRSGGLGGPGDKAVFRALRATADVVLVGASTAKAEDYGPVSADEEVRARREAQGRAPRARLAVVTGRLSLDPGAKLFAGVEEPPFVITTQRAADGRGRAFEGLCELIVAGDDALDLTMALTALGATGAGVVLCEGGPHLNGELLAAGLVDEWCQTIAPLLAAGGSARAAVGEDLDEPMALRLHRLLEQDAFLFGTWRRAQ